MESVLMQIAEACDRMAAEGRTPSEILLGNLDAAELEQELNWYAVMSDDERPVFLDLVNLTGTAQLFGVPLRRVDQPRLVGVIAEGYGG